MSPGVSAWVLQRFKHLVAKPYVMAADNPESPDLQASTYRRLDDIIPTDFVIPLSHGERILLAGIDSAYFSTPDDESNALHAELEGANITEISETDDQSNLGSDLLSLVLEQLRTSADEVEPLEILGSGSMNIPENKSTEMTGYMRVFRGWAWGSKVEGFVEELQDDEADIIKEFNGDRVQAFWNTIHWLKSPYQANTFRTNMLLDNNTHVCDKLDSITHPFRFRFVPLASDIRYWDTLMGMYLVEHRTDLMKIDVEGSPLEDSGYDIWKVVQQFSLSRRRPNNPEMVFNHLIQSTLFQTRFMVRKAPTKAQRPSNSNLIGPPFEEDKFEIVDRQAVSESSISENIEKTSEGSSEDMLSMDKIRKMLQSMYANLPLDDPSDYVEFLPWDELVPISSSEVNKHVTYLRSVEVDPTQQWRLWKPPSDHFFDSHHLHTEDEVYQYCIMHSWMFPGHSYRGAVVFALSPLENTKFVDDLRNFWKKWV